MEPLGITVDKLSMREFCEGCNGAARLRREPQSSSSSGAIGGAIAATVTAVAAHYYDAAVALTLACAGGFCALLMGAFILSERKRGETLRALNEAYPMRFTFAADGMSVSSASHASFYAWTAIDTAKALRHTLVILLKDGTSFTIPRRAIPTAAPELAYDIFEKTQEHQAA